MLNYIAVLSLLPIVLGVPYGENAVAPVETPFVEPIQDDYREVFIPEVEDNPPQSEVYFIPMQERDVFDDEMDEDISPDLPIQEWREPEDAAFYDEETYEVIHPEPLMNEYDLPIDQGEDPYEFRFTPDVPVVFPRMPHPNALDNTLDFQEKEAFPYLGRSAPYPIIGVLGPLASRMSYEPINEDVPVISRELEPPIYPFER